MLPPIAIFGTIMSVVVCTVLPPTLGELSNHVKHSMKKKSQPCRDLMAVYIAVMCHNILAAQREESIVCSNVLAINVINCNS